MAMNADDTIAAISSAVGRAPRIIVRMSGADAFRIARGIVESGELPDASHVSRVRLRLSNQLTFAACVFAFASPRSVTGEDVFEFHIPGNALLARMLLDDLIARGARQAEPGEFTARAYFNGKVDLAEAEGVAAAVSASSQVELDAARRLMSGALAKRLEPLIESVAQTLALLEVGIDFSEEDVTFLARDDALSRMNDVTRDLQKLLDESPRFERLHYEPTIVLAGLPNAGKSTLLNALAGHERAVTSDVAGTTRDAISAHVKLRRGLVRVIDVAGFDPGAHDPIGRKMLETALRTIESADFLLLVADVTAAAPSLPSRWPDLVVRTKRDLLKHEPGEFTVSAVTGEGMELLRDRLDALAFGSTSAASDALALNARHVRAIADAVAALARARELIDSGPEIIAVELREALDALGSVLGRVTPDDVLSRVFAAFCIGK